MDEYIKREALVHRLKSPYLFNITQRIFDIISEIPAADVAPVARCKNCKWFADNNDGEWYGCQMFHVVLITPEDAPKPNDFCSYGERKDGGADNG